MKWEYHICALLEVIDTSQEVKFLNKKGREGWELVAVVGADYYFKRPIKEVTPNKTVTDRTENDWGIF